MENCASCGHALGVGRFCINCGHPVGAPPPDDLPDDPLDEADWRTDTRERPVIRSLEPAVAPPPPPVHSGGAHRDPARSHWVPWVAGFAVLVVVAALGIWLLTGRTDPDAGDLAVDPPRSGSPRPSLSPSTTSSPTPTPSPTNPPPSATATKEPAEPEDVARLAVATVPATASPNEDLSGNLVRYEARNMLDGVPETCWRMPGDASGEEIVFTLAGPTRLTEVGVVNGYAKTATDARGQSLDWYHGNRRVLEVEWTFDNGSSVSQSLGDTRELQSLTIDPVTTSTVRLRLVSVSAPGAGRSARDYTALSDVALVGTIR